MIHFELTNQQKEALIKTKHWWKTKYKQLWEISGCSGSGKSTLVYKLIEEIGLNHNEVLFMAYVGKATLVLSRKGNNAQTIHSTLYDVVQTPIDKDVDKSDLEGYRVKYKIEFIKKERLNKNIKLLVVDEAGMVPEQMAKDILSFGIPVITLGDNNQLEPVFGERYFLQKPDIKLTEPMRQALDSPIVYLAQLAMKGKYIKRGNYGNNCYVIPKDMITDRMLVESDVVLCCKNKTRHEFNKHIREDIYGITKEYPVVGDKLVCVKNNWKECIDDNIYLINGMVGFVDNVYLDSYNGSSIKIDFRPDFLDDDCYEEIIIDYRHLTKCGTLGYKDMNNMFGGMNKFEFGYAITAWKAQGSEWDNIFVYDEPYGTNDFRKKVLYTQITRAKKGIILAM